MLTDRRAGHPASPRGGCTPRGLRPRLAITLIACGLVPSRVMAQGAPAPAASPTTPSPAPNGAPVPAPPTSPPAAGAPPGAAPPPAQYTPVPYPYPYPYPYPAPGYAAPPTAPPAPATPAAPPAPEKPAVLYDWDPDAPPPDGYRVVSSMNGRLIVTGAGLLAGGWLVSVLAGSVGAAAEEDEINDAADGVTAGDWSALYVPVIGPFLAIHTLDARTSGVGVLVADGVLQVGGAAGIVAGILDKKYKAVRRDVAGFDLAPLVGPGLSGVTATGRF